MTKNAVDIIRSSKNSNFKIFKVRTIFIFCSISQHFYEIDVDNTWQNLRLRMDTFCHAIRKHLFSNHYNLCLETEVQDLIWPETNTKKPDSTKCFFLQSTISSFSCVGFFTKASTYPIRRELVLLEDLACVTHLFR